MTKRGRVILKHQLRQPVVLFLGAIIAVIALGAIFHMPINRQMHTWKLLPEPERLTELYFTDPNNLPSTYDEDETQTVAFTVHNLEYRTTKYQYQIKEINQDGTQSVALANGSFSLNQNEYQKTAVKISTPDLGPRVKVEITLTNVDQSIDYLLQKEGA